MIKSTVTELISDSKTSTEISEALVRFYAKLNSYNHLRRVANNHKLFTVVSPLKTQVLDMTEYCLVRFPRAVVEIFSTQCFDCEKCINQKTCGYKVPRKVGVHDRCASYRGRPKKILNKWDVDWEDWKLLSDSLTGKDRKLLRQSDPLPYNRDLIEKVLLEHLTDIRHKVGKSHRSGKTSGMRWIADSQNLGVHDLSTDVTIKVWAQLMRMSHYSNENLLNRVANNETGQAIADSIHYWNAGCRRRMDSTPDGWESVACSIDTEMGHNWLTPNEQDLNQFESEQVVRRLEEDSNDAEVRFIGLVLGTSEEQEDFERWVEQNQDTPGLVRLSRSYLNRAKSSGQEVNQQNCEFGPLIGAYVGLDLDNLQNNLGERLQEVLGRN